MAEDRKRLLLNLISDVKGRLDGKVEGVAFPIPQFVCIGKQSVGKSRLIEALAGETFNFVSGSLGSRRPTVLEFRNDPNLKTSRWSIYNDQTNVWELHPIERVMKIIGEKHESLGTSVSDVAVRVKVEGEGCTDLSIVDLPGFRAYAKDAAMQQLTNKIDMLAAKYMADENNVMLCVEEAGDAAGFSSLGRCKQVDPSYRRTILIRNKLDKYYGDLTAENINKWLEGFGDLPSTLVRFALSLPHWPESTAPKPFPQMRKECAEKDVKALVSKGASSKYAKTIGFTNFQNFVEVKMQQLFADALAPMLTRMRYMKDECTERLEVIRTELDTIDEDNILHHTRSAGITFAQSFQHVMEGSLTSNTNRITLDQELRDFQKHCLRNSILTEKELQIDSMSSLDEYIAYLRDTVKVPGMDVELNGGAQFKRLMCEVEVFTRFAGVGGKFRAEDVIQARGSSLQSITWEHVIVNLLMQNAPTRIREKTKYVGERLKWFFTQQKDATIQFMATIQGSPEEHLFSKIITRKAQIIERNEAMKTCIYKAFDDTCEYHRGKFMWMWSDYMDSMFQSPLVLLKSSSRPPVGDTYDEELAPTFESTKNRVNQELTGRQHLSKKTRDRIKQIPDEDLKANQAVTMVQEVIEMVFGYIRNQVADQMQLYSESFFLLPMLRRLEGSMAGMELADNDIKLYRARKGLLTEEETTQEGLAADLTWCISAVEKFKVTCGGGQ
mmetsp:Transcript_5303/g.12770  ORF Transcript_5303/g.12770 Transcript_5303/m.12770 type:complete len:724 (+) Transcript_5303:126-2297(+)